MAATILGKIDDSDVFLMDLSDVYCDRLNKLSIKDHIGNNNEILRFKAYLLTVYYEILVDYMDITDVDDTNFFTVSEIFDVLQHFNNIANSYIDMDFMQPS